MLEIRLIPISGTSIPRREEDEYCAPFYAAYTIAIKMGQVQGYGVDENPQIAIERAYHDLARRLNAIYPNSERY